MKNLKIKSNDENKDKDSQLGIGIKDENQENKRDSNDKK
jgi:hypothetical protein